MPDTPEMVTITIDGAEIQAPKGEWIIKTAEDSGTYIPRFCYHPRMSPVGMCRMCLVEVETPRGRLLTTACNFPAGDGLIVDTRSEVVEKAQQGILEFLLINHPLDCPVCDKGGECPLQDQTVAYGPGDGRFVEEKRHYEKPIPLSELVFMDRERCILCARCTRFSDDVSGDPLIEFVGRGNTTQVITFPDEPFASYFSGNTVQICPVGALTAKPYRFKARPWDLEAVESVSMVDASGASVSVEASQNQVVRIDGVDNDATNHGWLSDKDRYIFEHLTSPHRIATPLVRNQAGELEPSTWGEALEVVATRLLSVHGREVGCIGGANNTNEEAFALSKFMRTVVVSPHIDARVGNEMNAELLACVASRGRINDIDSASTVLVWGGDLKEEFPSLYLRVRRAATDLGVDLVVIHPRRTGLDDVAAQKVTYKPGDGPEVLRKLVAGQGDMGAVLELLSRGNAVVIAGPTGRTEDPGLAEAVAAFVCEFADSKVLPLARRGNIFGALDMGLAPSLLPGRVSSRDEAGHKQLEKLWGPIPNEPGRSTSGMLDGLVDGDLTVLVLVGADPVRDGTDPAGAMAALDAADFVVAFDTFLTESSSRADVVLPIDIFSETEGTVTNLEGRVQKLNRVVPSLGQSRALWSALDELAVRMGGDLGAESAQVLAKAIAEVAPAYSTVSWDRLDLGEDTDGIVVPDGDSRQPLSYTPVDAGLRPIGGRLTLHLGRSLFDGGSRVRHSEGLAALTPEAAVHVHPREAAKLAVNDGEVVKVLAEDRALHLPIRIDPTLLEGAVYIPANLDETWELGTPMVVSIERLLGGPQ